MTEGGRPPRPSRPWPDGLTLDAAIVNRLNDEWRVTSPAPPSSLKQRLARPFRRLFGALLRGQETFNSTVVRQLNHLHQVNTVTADRQESLRAMADDVFFRSEVLFDRAESMAGRSEILSDRIDDLAAHVDALAAHVAVRFNEVHATLGAQGEAIAELQRFPEAFSARARRLEDAMALFRGEHGEIRTALGVLQQQTNQLAKQAGRGAPASATATADEPVAAGAAAAGDAPAASHALSHKYVGFEDAFRGSPEAIREGLRQYVPLFEGASDVLDVGCGRGEFLALLTERGIRGRGIDLNETMVDVCRDKGLDATAADALGYLRALPDGSLGGLFAAQVVEHLEPAYLTHFLEVAVEKLRPGAPIVLETINPACWFAFFESYIRDITHVRALHPDTLTFLLVASGFQQAEVRYSSPYPEHHKLQPVAAPAGLADTAETLNANVEKINRLLFTYLDYAAIARRP